MNEKVKQEKKCKKKSYLQAVWKRREGRREMERAVGKLFRSERQLEGERKKSC